MPSADYRKIVLIVRETRLDELIARFNTVQQAQFYVEHLGADFGDYLEEQRQYRAAVQETEATLRAFARVQRVDRRFVPNFLFGPDDMVVVLGQDGLVANTLKYLDGQHVLGVNPDPKRWDGVLLPFRANDLRKVIPEALAGRRPIKTVTMAKASLNTGEVLHAVNDLFIGPSSHVSARYTLSVGEQRGTAVLQRHHRVDRHGLDRLAEEPLCGLGGRSRPPRRRAAGRGARRIVPVGCRVPALFRARAVPEPHDRRRRWSPAASRRGARRRSCRRWPSTASSSATASRPISSPSTPAQERRSR